MNKQTKRLSKNLMRSLGLLLLVILLADFAQAARVQKAKGKRVMIQLEGLAVEVGSELFALNSEQKRKAVIRVSAIKGDMALGQVIQGNALEGMLLIIKSSQPTSGSPTGSDRMSDREVMRKSYKQGFGLVGGMAMSSAALTARTKVGTTIVEDSLAMKGNSFNFKAIYDYHISPSFTVRAGGGLETLSTTGSVTAGKEAVCSGSSSCTLSLNYLSFEGSAQFNFTSGPTRFWAGAGYAFLMAMSKSNNISNLEATSTNQVLFLGSGADIAIGNKGYIPIVVEYGLFPFAGIQLSGIYIRSGYGWKF